MKEIQKVSDLLLEKEAVKVLSTISLDGTLHSIAAGSITPIDQDTIAVAEVFMNTTAKNLTDTGKGAILACKGFTSFLLNVSVQKRHIDGPLFEQFKEKFAAMNLVPKAVWTFTVDSIFDQSAAPNAGEKLY